MHAPVVAQSPQAQFPVQVRVSICVPQVPHASLPVSVAPGVHTPSPVHAPSFVHSPPTQRWVCIPQRPHGMVCVPSPVHAQSVGASHALQTPSVQVSVPSPQPLAQLRLPVRPTFTSASSQSTSRRTPSPSPSTPLCASGRAPESMSGCCGPASKPSGDASEERSRLQLDRSARRTAAALRWTIPSRWHSSGA